jgi:ABC-type glycerol-3-phosphate transport system permease component
LGLDLLRGNHAVCWGHLLVAFLHTMMPAIIAPVVAQRLFIEGRALIGITD